LQAIGVLLRNQLYAGVVDVTEYGVRGKRGDYEPLISDDLSTVCKPSSPGDFRAPHHNDGLTRTSRYAPSCAASPAGEASPAAG
jgi:hypothetical protein